MSEKPIIEVEGLWKRYGLPPILPWKKHKDDDDGWALRDISFSVPRGGSLGILGRNGAGKSTLLKLLAGVTPADKGSIAVRGSVFPMIELTAGMSSELSGRENVKILGTIMGLSNTQIQRMIPKVHKFSELGKWFNRPVWKYSSGMVGRLAFGIAVNIQADILLVDEVLATGDIMFQKKCQQKMQEILATGTTLIFVTHAPYQAARLCEQGMVLRNGKIYYLGSSQGARQAYLEENIRHEADGDVVWCADQVIPDNYPRQGTGQLRITRVCLGNGDGELLETLHPWDDCTVSIYYTIIEEIRDINISLRMMDNEDRVALSLSTSNAQIDQLSIGHGVFKCRIPHLPVVPGFITLQVKIVAGLLVDSIQSVLKVNIKMTDTQLLETANLAYTYAPGIWEIQHNDKS